MEDKGLTSRKFIAFAGSAGLVLLGAVISAKYTGFAAQYERFCDTLALLLGLYLGGNVGSAFAFRGKGGAALTGARQALTDVRQDKTEDRQEKTDTRQAARDSRQAKTEDKLEEEGTEVIRDN